MRGLFGFAHLFPSLYSGCSCCFKIHLFARDGKTQMRPRFEYKTGLSCIGLNHVLYWFPCAVIPERGCRDDMWLRVSMPCVWLKKEL